MKIQFLWLWSRQPISFEDCSLQPLGAAVRIIVSADLSRPYSAPQPAHAQQLGHHPVIFSLLELCKSCVSCLNVWATYLGYIPKDVYTKDTCHIRILSISEITCDINRRQLRLAKWCRHSDSRHHGKLTDCDANWPWRQVSLPGSCATARPLWWEIAGWGCHDQKTAPCRGEYKELHIIKGQSQWAIWAN